MPAFRIQAYTATSRVPTMSPQYLVGPPRPTIESALDGFRTSLLNRHPHGGYVIRAVVTSGSARDIVYHDELTDELRASCSTRPYIHSIMSNGAELWIEHVAVSTPSLAPTSTV